MSREFGRVAVVAIAIVALTGCVAPPRAADTQTSGVGSEIVPGPKEAK